jgi:hypothetical protein
MMPVPNCVPPPLQPRVDQVFTNSGEAAAIATTATACHSNVVGSGAAAQSTHAQTTVVANSAEPGPT